MLAIRPRDRLAHLVRGYLAASAWRTSAAILSTLPPSGLERLSMMVGGAGFSLIRLRRRVVERQIAQSFPERSSEWVVRTARACYRHFAGELLSMCGARPLRHEALLARTAGRREAVALLQRHRRGGQGAVIVTGHLGNWELAGAFLAAAGAAVTAVVRRHDSAFDRQLVAFRRSLGVESVAMERAAVLPRRLARGGVVALVADQHAAGRGIPVSFLGRPASTFQGPARLALACGVPLYFGALLREGGGYRALLAPVEPSGLRDDPELALTRGWVSLLEEAVRCHPEQYFWFHRRWKLAGRERPLPAVSRRNEPARLVQTGHDALGA